MVLFSDSPVPGFSEEINKLRTRHQQLINSIAKYEHRVADQTEMLSRLNRTRDMVFDCEEKEGDGEKSTEEPASISHSMQEAKLDEGEIRDLEKRKYILESRVAGIEKDLAGVLG